MMPKVKIVHQNTKMETFQNYLLTMFLTLLVVSVMFEALGFSYIHNSDPRLQPKPVPVPYCTSQEALQWWTNSKNLEDVRKKLCYNALALPKNQTKGK